MTTLGFLSAAWAEIATSAAISGAAHCVSIFSFIVFWLFTSTLQRAGYCRPITVGSILFCFCFCVVWVIERIVALIGDSENCRSKAFAMRSRLRVLSAGQEAVITASRDRRSLRRSPVPRQGQNPSWHSGSFERPCGCRCSTAWPVAVVDRLDTLRAFPRRLDC